MLRRISRLTPLSLGFCFAIAFSFGYAPPTASANAPTTPGVQLAKKVKRKARAKLRRHRKKVRRKYRSKLRRAQRLAVARYAAKQAGRTPRSLNQSGSILLSAQRPYINNDAYMMFYARGNSNYDPFGGFESAGNPSLDDIEAVFRLTYPTAPQVVVMECQVRVKNATKVTIIDPAGVQETTVTGSGTWSKQTFAAAFVAPGRQHIVHVMLDKQWFLQSCEFTPMN